MRRLAFAMLAVLGALAGCTFERAGSKPDAPDPDPPDAPKTDAAPVADCPVGYEPINSMGMYRVVEGADKSWQNAAADCDNDDDTGGPYRRFTHLVVLGNDAERTGITGGTPITGNTWIGLSDLATEGTYVWVTAEPTSGYPMVGMKPPWDSDDPDDAGGNEDCIRFKNDFTLEDKPCTDVQSYVCECDAFPPTPR